MKNKMQLNEEHYITALSEFIKQEYGIKASSILPAKRGYYGETWQLNTAEGSYFLKLDYSLTHQIKYRRSLAVLDYLCASGIDFISEIVKTKTGDLFSLFNSAVLGVFIWIDGENIETDETKIPEYQMLCKIYARTKPGFDIPRLMFSDKTAADFFLKWEQLKTRTEDEDSQKICTLFAENSGMLDDCAARLRYFAEICQKDTLNFYFTHGDAGGNLLAGKHAYFLIDWDEVMYAPPERDAWVMCGHEWAMNQFNRILSENRINYQLRPKRLAFYCYHMFFYYLNELLEGSSQSGKHQEIADYFNGWIMERLEYAGTIL